MFNTRNIKYYFLFFILLFAVLAPAQRKKKNVIAKTKTSIPVTRNGIYESLLQSTAKVMFVDSIVVDKDNFLQFIPQPKEMGTISLSKDSFGLVQYQNELGDRRFFAVGDTAASDLKIQTSLGSSWGEPVNLVGINNREYFIQNYPFLAADGITLFFSAESTYSMGGRDIFMTYELLAYLSVRATQIGMKACEIPVTRAYPKTGKTPTKISFFKGNSELLRILFKNMQGAYNPL